MPSAPRRARTLGGAGIALTGLVCPCHALTGITVAALAAVGGSTPVLPPSVQDGLHAIYVPVAVVLGARLLTSRRPARVEPPSAAAGDPKPSSVA